MPDQEVPAAYIDAIQQGWRRDLKEAVNAALVRDGVPVGESVEIVVEVRRLSENPLHDYKVSFR